MGAKIGRMKMPMMVIPIQHPLVVIRQTVTAYTTWQGTLRSGVLMDMMRVSTGVRRGGIRSQAR